MIGCRACIHWHRVNIAANDARSIAAGQMGRCQAIPPRVIMLPMNNPMDPLGPNVSTPVACYPVIASTFPTCGMLDTGDTASNVEQFGTQHRMPGDVTGPGK